MEWSNIVSIALQAYLAVSIAKSILALADVHVAIGAANRITGKPTWLLSGMFVAGIWLTTLFLWPKLLVVERWKFFMTYSRFSVIRDVAKAYRDAEAEASAKGA